MNLVVVVKINKQGHNKVRKQLTPKDDNLKMVQ